MMAGRAPPGAWLRAGSSSKEEYKTDLSQPPSMNKGGAWGRLAVPRESSRRRVTRRAGPRRASGWFAPLTGLTTRAPLLGVLEDSGEGNDKRNGSSVISVNSARRALRSKDQEKQRKDQELGREKAYSSVVKYFLRFSRRQG